MTIEKVTKIDKIEIVGEYKHIQVRERTDIVEDGEVISSSYHRWMIAPDQDFKHESEDVKFICNKFHTEANKKAYIENDLLIRKES